MDLFLRRHYLHRSFTPELAKWMLVKYIERLDPQKTYFLEEEIRDLLNPSETLLQKIIEDSKKNEFPVFFQIHKAFCKTIKRREAIEAKKIPLPI